MASDKMGNSQVGLRSDKQWSQLEGHLCRITGFMPVMRSEIKNGEVVGGDRQFPYAGFSIESRRIPKGLEVMGFCTHKLDFENLWDVFNSGYLDTDTEEVLMFWSRKHYNSTAFKLLSTMSPKMVIMVCKKGTFATANNHTWPKGEKLSTMLERYNPHMVWAPDAMRSSRQ